MMFTGLPSGVIKLRVATDFFTNGSTRIVCPELHFERSISHIIGKRIQANGEPIGISDRSIFPYYPVGFGYANSDAFVSPEAIQHIIGRRRAAFFAENELLPDCLIFFSERYFGIALRPKLDHGSEFFLPIFGHYFVFLNAFPDCPDVWKLVPHDDRNRILRIKCVHPYPVVVS